AIAAAEADVPSAIVRADGLTPMPAIDSARPSAPSATTGRFSSSATSYLRLARASRHTAGPQAEAARIPASTAVCEPLVPSRTATATSAAVVINPVHISEISAAHL